MRPMRLLPLVLVLPLAALACSPGTSVIEDQPGGNGKRGGNAIVNGQATMDYPATVALTQQGSSMCTGTLIAPRKVLTAAHCLDNMNPSDYTVSFGASEGQFVSEVGVVGGVQHPQWDPNSFANDIAILTLDQDAQEQPIDLNPLMDQTWIGKVVTLVGFGVDDGVNQSGSGVKREVGVTIAEVSAGEFKYLTQNGQTACNGDSGGPAFVDVNGQLIVVGVTSRGDQNCQQEGIYTRVDAYLDFINTELQNPGCDPNVDPNCGNNQSCDPNVDPNCMQGCDPNVDPNCMQGCDPNVDPNCMQGCDPNDPFCQGGCDPNTDPFCCDPYFDPYCQGGCDPNDPNCQGGCDPNDPFCQGGGGGCNGETYEGRCDGNVVIWCEDDQVYEEQCPGACGMDPQAGYYACM